MTAKLSIDQEADWLLKVHGGEAGALAACLRIVSDQLTVLQSRSQLLLTLATLTLTITGFSGPQIARSSAFARHAIVAGLLLVLCAILGILLGSLRVQWVTQVGGAEARGALCAALRYRDFKTRLYRAELILLVIGLSAYVSSVVTYLLSLTGKT